MASPFANPRAHLTPTFRRAHITVAAVAAIVVAVVLPAALTWMAGLHSIGLVAAAVFMLGVSLSAKSLATHSSCLLMATSWFVIMGLMFEPLTGNSHLAQFIGGQYEPVAFCLLTAGAALALLGGFRLIRLDEDQPAYHMILLTQNRLGRNGTPAWNMAEWCAAQPGMQQTMQKCSPREERYIATLIGHVQRASISQWSRVRRWHVTPIGCKTIVAWCFTTVLIVQLFVWFLPKADVPMVAIMLTLFPALGGFGGIAQALMQTLVYEFCLPVDRVTYVRELFARAALGQLQFWASTSIALVSWRLVTARQSSELVSLGVALAISACLQIPIFGMFAWMAQRRKISFRVIMGAVTCGFSMGLASIAMETSKDYLPGVIAAAPVFAAIGLLIVWHAYRRWLLADVD
jgi:hypothetical protein